MADLAREDAPEPETAPGKRGVDQAADQQAEPQKRARTSESATEPAALRDEAERPSDSPAGDAAEEDAAPVSRGLALAEKQIQQEADEARAAGDTQLADAIEASLVTTAPQREAALVPRQVPAGASDIDQLKHSLFSEAAEDARSMGDEIGADICEFLDTDEEKAEYERRNEDHRELVVGYHVRKRSPIAAGIYE